MKCYTPLIAALLFLYPIAAAHAADSSSNMATPATPYPGQNEAATPAMPGNPTAQEKVIENRENAQALRDEAEERAAEAQEHGDINVDHPDVGRPDVELPDTAARPYIPDVGR